MDGAVVAAHEVARRYGEGETAVDALRGVSLEVSRGQLTAVSSPSSTDSETPRRASTQVSPEP